MLEKLNITNPLLLGALAGGLFYLVLYAEHKKNGEETSFPSQLRESGGISFKLPIIVAAMVWAVATYFNRGFGGGKGGSCSTGTCGIGSPAISKLSVATAQITKPTRFVPQKIFTGTFDG